MKTNLIKKMILAVIVVAGVYLVSCNKERLIRPSIQTSNLESFFKANAAQRQSFRIQNSQYQSITGSKGTILTFRPNTFVNANGSAVTGEVEIFLREIYDKADMILSNKPTMATDGILVSGGEISVEAFQNGNELKLAPGMTISASFPKNGTELPMKYFDGQEEDGQVLWTLGDTTITVQDSSNYCMPAYYCLELEDVNWANCDYYFNDPRPLTDIEIEVPENMNDTNTAVFLVPDNDNIVIRLYEFNNGKFSVGWGYQVPVGLKGTLVAISEINGNFSSAFLHTTITQNHYQSLVFSPTTLAQFTSDLSNL
ncbi:MAG: hypothetical protein J0M08_07190 [Bacteroidetes bacterium]|nr:hypothetical protein [Bacteroidota bacterium]